MGEKLEAMWLSERYDMRTTRVAYKIFRARDAVRAYNKQKTDSQKIQRYRYTVIRATWGPEQ